MAILYGIFFIKDTKKVLQQQRSIAAQSTDSEIDLDEKKGTSIREAFRLSHIKEAFGTAFKKREGGIRHIVVILILTFGISGVAMAAGSQVL